MTKPEVLNATEKKELNFAKLRIERFLKLAALKQIVDESEGDEAQGREVFVIEDSEPIKLLEIDPLNQPMLDEAMLSLFGHTSWSDSKRIRSTEEDEIRNVFRLPLDDGMRTAFFQRSAQFEDHPIPGSEDRRRVNRITYSVMAVPPEMRLAIDEQLLPPDIEELQGLANFHLLGSLHTAPSTANVGSPDKDVLAVRALIMEALEDQEEATYDMVEVLSGSEFRILGNAALGDLDTDT